MQRVAGEGSRVIADATRYSFPEEKKKEKKEKKKEGKS